MRFDELEELEGETQIVGTLTVYGRDKEISARVNVEINKNEIILIGDFYVEVADFDIKIPAIVANNIAKTIKVNFELRHKPYKM